jgi:hypothetical protein
MCGQTVETVGHCVGTDVPHCVTVPGRRVGPHAVFVGQIVVRTGQVVSAIGHWVCWVGQTVGWVRHCVGVSGVLVGPPPHVAGSNGQVVV